MNSDMDLAAGRFQKLLSICGRPRRMVIWLLIAILTIVPTLAVDAAVTLSSFSASGGDHQVLVTWQTATEFDNAGFIIWSSDFEDGPYDPVSDFVPSQGGGVTGGNYSFVDTEVENGVRYFYKLEAIALDQSSEYYGPISAVAGVPTPTATQGPTSTPTKTSTLMPSATVPTNTPTVTRTLRSTRTPTLIVPTSSFQASASLATGPTSTESGYPYPPSSESESNPYPMVEIGATNIPTVISEAESSPTPNQVNSNRKTPSATPEAVSMNSDQSGAAGVEDAAGSPPPGGRLPRYFALVVVLLVWILLAGWFVSSWRRME